MKRSPLKRKTPLRAKSPLKRTRLAKRARNQTDTQKLHSKLWKLFSEFVRRKEGGRCFSCGVIKDWKEMQAGHYIHNVLDFDELNVHCQCVRCNKWLSGNGTQYSFELIKHYGLDAFNDLHFRATKALAGEKHEKEWYEEKIAYYKDRLSKL